MFRKRLGEILIEKRLITEEQLAECLEEQKLTKEYVGAILLKKRLIKESDLMSALSVQFQMPFISLKMTYIDWNVSKEFASIIAAEEKILPIAWDDASITAAISNPLDVMSIAKIEERARPKKLKLVLVTQLELLEFLGEFKKRTKGSLKDLLDK